jgi:hypothetical protein
LWLFFWNSTLAHSSTVTTASGLGACLDTSRRDWLLDVLRFQLHTESKVGELECASASKTVAFEQDVFGSYISVNDSVLVHEGHSFAQFAHNPQLVIEWNSLVLHCNNVVQAALTELHS